VRTLLPEARGDRRDDQLRESESRDRAIEKLGGYVTVTDGEFSPKFRPRPLAV
jgi:hypothetical protein